MRKWSFLALFFGSLCLQFFPFDAEGQQVHKFKHGAGGTASGEVQTIAYPTMPGPGKKVSIGNDYYFLYGFDRKPKIGTVILKVEVFNKDGKKEASLEVKADSGMPSMKGAHESGDRPFILSKKGDYLLPIDLVMPGDWEIRLTFLKEGKVIFRGSHQFDV